MQRLPHGSEARAYQRDVSSREAVFRFAVDVKREFRAVHDIVNNAGMATVASVEHLTIAEIEAILNVNLWSVINGTKAFLPIMLAQREGCILNVSSVFGLLHCQVMQLTSCESLRFAASRRLCGRNFSARAFGRCSCIRAGSTPT
jgi:short-subunit dehydrogenase